MKDDNINNNNSVDQDELELMKFKEQDAKFCNLMKQYYKEKEGEITPTPEFRARIDELFIENKKKLIAEGKIKNDWTNRIKDLDLSWVVRITVPVAATIFIIGMGVAIFYYFTDNKNTLPIANSPTPIVTSRPITNNPTPTPIPSASPTIVENNKTNENNKLNGNPENNNSVSVVKESNNTNKVKKSNNIKKDSSNKDNIQPLNSVEKEYLHKEEIANANNNKNNVSIKEASENPDLTRGNSVKDIVGLSEVKTIYISTFDTEEDKELRKALIDILKKSTKLTLLTPSQVVNQTPNGILRKTGDLIQVVSGVSDKLLWEKSIKSFVNISSEETANKLINELIQDIEKDTTKP